MTTITRLMKYKIQVLSTIFSVIFFGSLSCQNVAYSVGDSISKYIYNKPQKAIAYCNEYIRLSKKDNSTKEMILGYSALATAYGVINEPDSTLHYYYKSLSLVEDPVGLIVRKYYIARVYDINYNYNEALRLYNQILKLARKENRKDIIDDINLSIELVKSKVDIYKSGFPKESLTFLENEYKEDLNKGQAKSLRYTRKKLIEVYIKDNQLERANKLIDEGLKQALAENNKEFLFYIYLLKSEVNGLNKNAPSSINDCEKALKYATDLKNQLFINQANFCLGQAAYNLGEYEQTLSYLNNIRYNKNNKTSLQLSRDFKLRADTYTKLDSIRLSNNYYNKYVEEKEKASKEYLEALKSIHTINVREQVIDVKDSYEVELQEEISEKEKQKKTKWLWTGISVTLLLFIVTLILLFKNKSKVNQKRFDDLMLKIKDFEERKAENKQVKKDNGDIKELVSKKETVNLRENFEADAKEEEKEELAPQLPTTNLDDNVDTSYVIDDKKVEEILVKLQNLEDKLYFLRQDCTLHNMAKRLKTNTSYLSKIINTHLDKSFSTYINELRINYAIIELKNNKKLRSYSVKGIAQEMGYKNADAFSRYFRAATGISPSVYIKKIQEI